MQTKRTLDLLQSPFVMRAQQAAATAAYGSNRSQYKKRKQKERKEKERKRFSCPYGSGGDDGGYGCEGITP